MSAPKSQVIDGHDLPYPALETPDSIRLLTLVGVKDGTASFRLETAALETNNNYIALSYEWGTDTATEDILVNDRKVKVRPNLYSFIVWALNNIHHRQIFIDAICINQQDAAEKQVQVALMGRVYSHAAEVIAWLGTRPRVAGWDRSDIPLSRLMDEYQKQKSDTLRRALRQACAARIDKAKVKQEEVAPRSRQLLHDLADEWKSRLARLRKTMPPASSFATLDESLREIEDMEILDLELLRSYFTATFWTRCWIVQELTLARHLTLQLGDQQVAAEVYLLLTSATLSDEIGLGGSLGAATDMIAPNRMDGPSYAVGKGTEHSGWELGVRLVRNVLSLRQQYQQTSVQSVGMPLHLAVDKTCNQRCSHPHDHVFSLLGIARTSVNVDYETNLLLLYVYVLAEGLRELFHGGKVARRQPPWNVPRAFMIAFHYSMAQPAVWVVTSQILQLYERRHGRRGNIHWALFMTQSLWSDSFMMASGSTAVLIGYSLVLRPVLAVLQALWSCLTHTYRRWRGKAVSGSAPDGVILGYQQWETVAKRVYDLVQNDEPLHWKTIHEVLADDADRFNNGDKGRMISGRNK